MAWTDLQNSENQGNGKLIENWSKTGLLSQVVLIVRKGSVTAGRSRKKDREQVLTGSNGSRMVPSMYLVSRSQIIHISVLPWSHMARSNRPDFLVSLTALGRVCAGPLKSFKVFKGRWGLGHFFAAHLTEIRNKSYTRVRAPTIRGPDSQDGLSWRPRRWRQVFGLDHAM